MRHASVYWDNMNVHCMQEGAEEAFSLLKRATVAVTPANEDLRTTLRSLVGAIASQADALSTGSLIETLSLLATWRLLSDNTALSLVSDISNRLESDQDDESLVRSCAAAMVQLRSNFDGTDAHQVAEASVAGVTHAHVCQSSQHSISVHSETVLPLSWCPCHMNRVSLQGFTHRLCLTAAWQKQTPKFLLK